MAKLSDSIHQLFSSCLQVKMWQNQRDSKVSGFLTVKVPERKTYKSVFEQDTEPENSLNRAVNVSPSILQSTLTQNNGVWSTIFEFWMSPPNKNRSAHNVLFAIVAAGGSQILSVSRFCNGEPTGNRLSLRKNEVRALLATMRESPNGRTDGSNEFRSIEVSRKVQKKTEFVAISQIANTKKFALDIPLFLADDFAISLTFAWEVMHLRDEYKHEKARIATDVIPPIIIGIIKKYLRLYKCGQCNDDEPMEGQHHCQKQVLCDNNQIKPDYEHAAKFSFVVESRIKRVYEGVTKAFGLESVPALDLAPHKAKIYGEYYDLFKNEPQLYSGLISPGLISFMIDCFDE